MLRDSVPFFEKLNEHRTMTESASILKLADKINFFKQAQKHCSIELVKSMIKFGKIIRVDENKIIT